MELVVILLILALIVAIFGFGGIPSVLTNAALTLFWMFLAFFIIAVIYRLKNGHWWFSREHDKNGQIIVILGLAILALVASIVVVFIRC
jgi:uncharacterized membrane protein YtjA (UPF0391 family)